ncbi:hypothetical protein [Luteolibacter sp.]|uniref:hypothetical protein n=1 Tax=Luteolibacter sp. TaxID=1962973 RepID=UPI003264655A
MIADLLPELSKSFAAGSPYAAVCTVLVVAMNHGYKLLVLRFHAAAVRKAETKGERDALVELFRLANPPKQVRGAPPIRKSKR